MGLLDGILGGVIGAEALSLVKGYVDKHGGLDGVVAELEKTGYGAQVKSWVGDGSNLPISADDIKKALGSEKIKELAASTEFRSTRLRNISRSICRRLSTRPRPKACCLRSSLYPSVFA